MSITDSQKVDILWKALQKRADSSTAKAFYEEANYSVAAIMATQVWAQADLIGVPAVASSSGVVTYQPSVLMTEDVTVSGQKSYTTTLKDWIHPSVDGSYQVRVYQNNGSGGLGSEVPPTDSSDWVFDYNSGTLTFFGTNSAHTKPYLIKGWRYSGPKGISAVATPHFSELFVNSDWTIKPGDVYPSIIFNHGLATASVQVDIFEDDGDGFYTPTYVDWKMNSTYIKLSISNTVYTAFTGKIEVRPI